MACTQCVASKAATFQTLLSLPPLEQIQQHTPHCAASPRLQRPAVAEHRDPVDSRIIKAEKWETLVET